MLSGSPGPDPSRALESLLTRRPSTRIVWGLDRIRSVLADLGDPQARWASIHIGGTNGKGSAAACAEAVLRTAGVRTGLYTSPHLIDFRERIRIDGRPADPELLASCAADLLPLVAAEDLTFFEAATALAFLAFARSSVQLAVVEVGLGGRLDATNVVSPEASAVTSVDLDHAEYLGDTLEAVAREKAGILKPGVPAVLGPVPDRILPVFEERAREVGTTLRLVGRDVAVESVETGPRGTSFIYRGPGRSEGTRLSVPLAGAHQAVNAAVAVAALDAAGRTPDTTALVEGLASVRWPGRFQIVRRPDGTWLLDVAHNPAGVRALADALGQVDLPHPRVCLVAILGDKPWRDMLDPVLRNATAAVLTVAPSSPAERRWDPSEARAAVSGHAAHVETDFDRALVVARELAGSGTVIVTGSCHTVGDALVRLGVSAA